MNSVFDIPLWIGKIMAFAIGLAAIAMVLTRSVEELVHTPQWKKFTHGCMALIGVLLLPVVLFTSPKHRLLLAMWLVKLAARLLPEPLRTRYVEEWPAELIAEYEETHEVPLKSAGRIFLRSPLTRLAWRADFLGSTAAKDRVIATLGQLLRYGRDLCVRAWITICRLLTKRAFRPILMALLAATGSSAGIAASSPRLSAWQQIIATAVASATAGGIAYWQAKPSRSARSDAS